MAKPYERCYPGGENKGAMILLFCCIPCWAWLALLGVGLMALGVLLLKISRAWR